MTKRDTAALSSASPVHAPAFRFEKKVNKHVFENFSLSEIKVSVLIGTYMMPSLSLYYIDFS